MMENHPGLFSLVESAPCIMATDTGSHLNLGDVIEVLKGTFDAFLVEKNAKGHHSSPLPGSDTGALGEYYALPHS